MTFYILIRLLDYIGFEPYGAISISIKEIISIPRFRV